MTALYLKARHVQAMRSKAMPAQVMHLKNLTIKLAGLLLVCSVLALVLVRMQRLKFMTSTPYNKKRSIAVLSKSCAVQNAKTKI
jgi:hypothetical protein